MGDLNVPRVEAEALKALDTDVLSDLIESPRVPWRRFGLSQAATVLACLASCR